MTIQRNTDEFWVLIPAAGAGRRMNAPIPKQYLDVAGKTVLQHAIDRMARVATLTGLVLATAPNDDRSDVTLPSHLACHKVVGGAERVHTVLAGLTSIIAAAGDQVWVLVHDAARPGVRLADVERLMAHCVEFQEGGLLAQPVRDTVKRSGSANQIEQTLPRDQIWLAQTPQCFRAGELFRALEGALAEGLEVTDEASAMAHFGHVCHLITGHWRNMKLTEPEDLPLIEWILTHDE